MWRQFLACLAVTYCVTSSVAIAPLAADDSTTPNQVHSSIGGVAAWCRQSMARVREAEAVQMVTAILKGSQMGPGEGWFHPGQSRYGWDWLVGRYDQDADGAITPDEFSGSAELFERLDRDRNGELKPDDFDWSDRSPFIKQQGQAGQWFSQIDNSSNGQITQVEWEQFFTKLAGEKRYVSREDLRLGLFPPSAKNSSLGRAAEGPSRAVLLKGVFNGELGSMWEGPSIDQRAPDFDLQTQNGKRTIRLSSFRNQKPVVLVFGSFT